MKKNKFINIKENGLVIVMYYLITLFSFNCFAEDVSVPQISASQFPALVFTQEDASLDISQRTSLMIATVNEGKAKIQKVMTAQYIGATQLSDTVFILQADQRPQDRSQWQQTQYIIDFKTGSKVLLCNSQSWDKLVHYICLRSFPEKNEAVLLRYGQGTDRSTLIQVNLKSLEIKLLSTFPEKDKMPEFNTNPYIKISPDFKKLAAMIGPYEVNQTQVEYVRQSNFSLRVLDINTMKTTIIDDKVNVAISALASTGDTPPFEWISPEEILYQNIITVDWKESQYVLKCANTTNITTTEWLTKTCPLTTRSGKISCDWFTKQVCYNDFIVDINNRALLPIISNYVIKRDSQTTEISFNNELLLKYNGYADVATSISSSKKNFAYFVRWGIQDGKNVALYVKTFQEKQPVLICELPSYTLLPEFMTWIENTDK
jgi:hypothetical protein